MSNKHDLEIAKRFLICLDNIVLSLLFWSIVVLIILCFTGYKLFELHLLRSY